MQPSTAQYWDRRLDALDWKRATQRSSRASWAKACRSFAAPATSSGLDLLGDLQGREVLELGTGHGQGAVHLAARGAQVIGLDISPARCAEAGRQLAGAPILDSIRFCAARAERLPFADQSFDCIFARDVLMYADPRTIASDCRRVLRPGGVLVFVESLRGPWFLRLFRRLTSPRSYRAFTRHISFRELRRCGAPLVPIHADAHYLFSLVAFLALFSMRSTQVHESLLRRLYPLDRYLLARLPFLNRWAWRGTVAFRRDPNDVD